MSKCLYIIYSNRVERDLQEKFQYINTLLEPDNTSCRKPIIKIQERRGLLITNPSPTIRIEDVSCCLGHLPFNLKDWKEISHPISNGSFAIFRNNNSYSEIVTDVVGSRTIWYYFDSEKFIASTSQRAIITILGNFKFNKAIIPWMLSSGSLGPGHSYDKRLKQLPPDSNLICDHQKWKIAINTNEKIFKPAKISKQQHKKRLAQSITRSFGELKFDFTTWYLPLSGGYDSRSILYNLTKNSSNGEDLKTITWGVKKSLEDPTSDSTIAQQLSDHFNTNHTFYVTETEEENISTIFSRFIKMTEGRIDHISGYMDGFTIWKHLNESKVGGVIRGDEGFGWEPVDSELYVRYSTSLSLCVDYKNLQSIAGNWNQSIPREYLRRKEESLASWRDRIYLSYRIPTILSALTDAKVGYVELSNPLLSKAIINTVLTIPDKYRTDKKLFKKIVDEYEIPIKFAQSSAIAPPKKIFERKDVKTYLINSLNTPLAKELFPLHFLKQVIQELEKTKLKKKSYKNNLSRVFKYIKPLVPSKIISLLRRNSELKSVNYGQLAFRIHIILSMVSYIYQDMEDTSVNKRSYIS